MSKLIKVEVDDNVAYLDPNAPVVQVHDPNPREQMTQVLANNTGELKQYDLRCELYREYTILVGGDWYTYRIDGPVALYIRPNGTTHRVEDTNGVVHCIPFGTGCPTILRWMNRPEAESACQF